MSSYSNNSKEDFNPLKTQPVKPNRVAKPNAGSYRYEQLKSCITSKKDPFNKIGGTQNITSLLRAIKKNDSKSYEPNLTENLLKSTKVTGKPLPKSRNGIQGPIYSASKVNNLTSSKSTLYETKQIENRNSKILLTYSSAKKVSKPTMSLKKPRKEVSRRLDDKLIISASSSSSCNMNFNETAIVKNLIKT